MSVDVAVLGSANLDLVLRVDGVPAPGETVLARGRESHPGGKGLNQAVAAARAGATTALVAAVGNDQAGTQLLTTLRASAVDTSAVRRVPAPSGVAVVMVQANGENAIVVDAGANATMTQLPASGRSVVRGCRVLVAQLEVPLAVVAEAAALARASGALVVLNAAPALPLDDAVLDLVDLLVVNEHEARQLAGRDAATDPVESGALLARGRREVVVTLGALGAVHLRADGGLTRTAGVPADVVDTTAAGDTFVGALAAGLAAGEPLRQAMLRAVVAGALAVEVAGAVPSIPSRVAVDERMAAVAATRRG